MDNGNFQGKKNPDGSPDLKKPLTARDAWHKKIYGEESGAEAASDASQAVYYGKAPVPQNRRKKSVMLFCCILAGVLVLAGIVAAFGGAGSGYEDENISGAASVRGSHIGVLYIEGAIGEDSDTYSQSYVIDAVEGMMENGSNEGLMLFVNTPGGGVYESDELYLKIKEYQEHTGRPVYAYFASQATSGGYYISASADKILANRNCWTGSIGVTMGTFYDISGLLQKHGIKTETITSGPNKAMGDITAPMTAEQRQIFQGLIDEAYDQFVSIVAEGRDLDEAYVRSIADGRIYTAKQAESNKLIDDITGTYDEALETMINDCGLSGCDIYEFRYLPEDSLLSGLMKSVDSLAESVSGSSDISSVIRLMEENNSLPLQYMCEEIK